MSATHAIVVKAYIWREGKLLLLKRRDDDEEFPGLWDTPGGRLHAGESALDGLKREAAEETGLALTSARPLSTWTFETPVETVLGISFLARDPSGTVHLSDEHVDFEWAAPERIGDLPAAENLKKEIAWLVSKGWHL
ncbi:MAG: NUDIX domain-containing protein [Parvibaculaceae bacterium]